MDGPYNNDAGGEYQMRSGSIAEAVAVLGVHKYL